MAKGDDALLFHKHYNLYGENTKLPSDPPIWLQHQASKMFVAFAMFQR
jgi:hypothetical protein